MPPEVRWALVAKPTLALQFAASSGRQAMAEYQVIGGTIVNSGSVRTFVDGQYFSRLTVQQASGQAETADHVFVPASLLQFIFAGSAGKFYFWNRHLYAVRTTSGISCDVDGARRLFFRRDQHILTALALSIILAPVSIWVFLRRAISAGTAEEMRQFLRS
jgi:hypothetical protein